MRPSWPSAVVALGFLGLIGVMFWVAADHDFNAIWTSVATIVGVAVGAIPSYFFKVQADDAKNAAGVAQQSVLQMQNSLAAAQQATNDAHVRAATAAKRAELYAAALPPDSARDVQAADPVLFLDH